MAHFKETVDRDFQTSLDKSFADVNNINSCSNSIKTNVREFELTMEVFHGSRF